MENGPLGRFLRCYSGVAAHNGAAVIEIIPTCGCCRRLLLLLLRVYIASSVGASVCETFFICIHTYIYASCAAWKCID